LEKDLVAMRAALVALAVQMELVVVVELVVLVEPMAVAVVQET
jgi:hypothetical protein